jgi:hypothetical protein
VSKPRRPKAVHTPEQVDELALVALSQCTGTVSKAMVHQRCGLKPKELDESLHRLKQRKLADHWPAIAGWRITEAGLEAAAAIQSRPPAPSPWTWQTNSKRSTP